MAFRSFRFFFLLIGQELLAKGDLHSCLTHTDLTSFFNGHFIIVQCAINGRQESGQRVGERRCNGRHGHSPWDYEK
jgi:hypothetical protein